VARALAESVSGDDLTWSAFGVDDHAGIARIAAEATPPGQPGPVRGDARALPFPDASFDAVLCNLTLHHFGQAEAIQIVREMARVSNGLVLIADLERRRAALLGARLLARTLWSRNPLVRHDGPVSVMRGFTPVELHEIAVKAGLVRARVRRVPVFRLLMTATVDPTRRV
jgi:SAM-dependent methyltransferase